MFIRKCYSFRCWISNLIELRWSCRYVMDLWINHRLDNWRVDNQNFTCLLNCWWSCCGCWIDLGLSVPAVSILWRKVEMLRNEWLSSCVLELSWGLALPFSSYWEWVDDWRIDRRDIDTIWDVLIYFWVWNILLFVCCYHWTVQVQANAQVELDHADLCLVRFRSFVVDVL